MSNSFMSDEIEKLKKENQILTDELNRIKTGIKKLDICMIVDGNDMIDWGWLQINQIHEATRVKLNRLDGKYPLKE